MNRLLTAGILTLVYLSTAAVPLAAEERIHIWVKSFIPSSIPSNPKYVTPVPGRPGKFMIAGPPPPESVVNDTSLLKKTCYLTDSRGFSQDLSASARITTEFILVVGGTTPKVEKVPGRELHYSSGSEALHCQTGRSIKTATATAKVPLTREPFKIGGPHIAGSRVQVIFQVAAADPLIPSPSLDYSLDVTYDTASGQLSFKGSVGKFPSFEAYAAVTGNPPQALFQLPPSGDTVWSLFEFGTGIGDRPISGTVNLRRGK